MFLSIHLLWSTSQTGDERVLRKDRDSCAEGRSGSTTERALTLLLVCGVLR